MHYLNCIFYSGLKKFVSIAELLTSNSLDLEYEKNPWEQSTFFPCLYPIFLRVKLAKSFRRKRKKYLLIWLFLAFILTSFLTPNTRVSSKSPKREKFHLIVANQSHRVKGHCLVVYCSGGLC